MQNTITCPDCHIPNPDSATNCSNCNTPLSSSTKETGDTIARRYRVLKKPGHGGMGVVYLVEQAAIEKNTDLNSSTPN